MKILIPTSYLVNMKFTFYSMQVNKVRNDTHKRYWISVFSKKGVLIPPLPIQRAIVSKIETLFTKLDQGIADLKKAQEQLKVYRQAVLKKAFEGELTKEWRENTADIDIQSSQKKTTTLSSEEQIVAYKIHDLNKLPEWWKWKKLGDEAELCLGKMLDKKNNHGKLQPYLGNINVRWGSFDIINLKKMKIKPNEEARYRIEKNDLVICEGGEPGRCAIWASEQTIYFQKALHRVRLSKHNNPYFFYYYFNYLAKTDLLKTYFTGTTIKHLTGTRLKEIRIPLPPKQEQHQIVQEIESRLSVCDKVEQNIIDGLEKSEALRQSILKKAFEGKLLSEAEIEKCKQEADYEPAGVLLERIKKEKGEK